MPECTGLPGCPTGEEVIRVLEHQKSQDLLIQTNTEGIDKIHRRIDAWTLMLVATLLSSVITLIMQLAK